VNFTPINSGAINTGKPTLVQRATVALQAAASIVANAHINVRSIIAAVGSAIISISGKHKVRFDEPMQLDGQAVITLKTRVKYRFPVSVATSADILVVPTMHRRSPISASAQAYILATGRAVFSPVYDRPAPAYRQMVVAGYNRTIKV